jgi:hypothetical protein
MRFQERFPRHTPPADRIESIFEKDAFDRVATDFMPEVVERASDSGVAPARVAAGHSENQVPDFSRGSRTAGPSPSAAIVLSCDQLPVPSKESIGSHQGLDLGETFSADLLGLHRKTPALLVDESQPFPTQLIPEGSVLFLEILVDFMLMATDPTGEDEHQELQRQNVHRFDSRAEKIAPMGRN